MGVRIWSTRGIDLSEGYINDLPMVWADFWLYMGLTLSFLLVAALLACLANNPIKSHYVPRISKKVSSIYHFLGFFSILLCIWITSAVKHFFGKMKFKRQVTTPLISALGRMKSSLSAQSGQSFRCKSYKKLLSIFIGCILTAAPPWYLLSSEDHVVLFKA